MLKVGHPTRFFDEKCVLHTNGCGSNLFPPLMGANADKKLLPKSDFASFYSLRLATGITVAEGYLHFTI